MGIKMKTTGLWNTNCNICKNRYKMCDICHKTVKHLNLIYFNKNKMYYKIIDRYKCDWCLNRVATDCWAVAGKPASVEWLVLKVYKNLILNQNRLEINKVNICEDFRFR